MKRVYCDTSVVIPAFLTEGTTVFVERWMASKTLTVFVSDFVHLEFVSAISRHVREKLLTSVEAIEIIRSFEAWRNTRLSTPLPDERTFADAGAILKRFELGVRAPDAFHLALAQGEKLSFATLDRRLSAAAVAIGLDLIAVPLS